MKLSYSVMAIPERKHGVDFIHQRLGFETPVSWECGKGVHDTHVRAWQMHDPDADYHLVLEDDAIPCHGFHHRALEWLERYDKPTPTNFYLGQRGDTDTITRRAQEFGFHKGRLFGGVAICLPVPLIQPMLEFYPTDRDKQGDGRIREFLLSYGLDCVCPIPSLVDHRHGWSYMCEKKLTQSAFRFIDNEQPPPRVGEIKVSASIMGIPSRAMYFPEIMERFGQKLPISLDTAGGKLIENCALAWRMHDSSADYHVVFQDDAILCRKFSERLDKVLRRWETPTPVALFWKNEGQGGEILAKVHGGFFGNLMWGLATVLPVSLIPPMLRSFEAQDHKADDMRIRRFLSMSGRQCFMPYPCLVEHRGLPTTTGTRGRWRATKFIDA